MKFCCRSSLVVEDPTLEGMVVQKRRTDHNNDGGFNKDSNTAVSRPLSISAAYAPVRIDLPGEGQQSEGNEQWPWRATCHQIRVWWKRACFT